MFVLCSTLALVCSQIFTPTIPAFKRVPELIPELFSFTFLTCVSMFLTFLYELTAYDPLQRTRLFRSELTKCFMTCILYQAITLLTMNWFFTLGSAIQTSLDAKEHDLAYQRKTFEVYLKKHWAHRPKEEWP